MFIIISLSLTWYLTTKVTGLTPGDKFDLANWKLTLPTVDSDGIASEIYPIDLVNHYESEYFYIDNDGAMTFYTTNGGTTPNSKYPRSELRQLCNPDSSNPEDFNWAIDSYNYVEGVYRIGELDDPTGRKVIIQQIHAYDAPPLVKIQYQSGGKVYALIKTDVSGDIDEKPLLGEVDGNETFILKTTVDYGYLKLYFNDELVVTRDVSFWSNYSNYFKAGNYMQSNDNGTYSYVHIYDLDVYTSSENCQFSNGIVMTTTMMTIEEEEEKEEQEQEHKLVTYIAVLITIVVIFIICSCIFQLYCYKKIQGTGKKVGFHHSTADSGVQL